MLLLAVTPVAVAPRGPLARRPLGPVATATVATGVVALVADERQRELAGVVDVVDADLTSSPSVEHVLDPVDALAATELRDVQQTVTAREDVHERTELGDVHDAAGVLGAELGGRRVEDQLDAAAGLFDLLAVLRADRHRADHAVVAAPRCRRRSPAGSC